MIAVTDNEVIIWLCLLTQVTDRRSRYAYRQGLFVIKTAGNMVKIVNGDNFKPKIW